MRVYQLAPCLWKCSTWTGIAIRERTIVAAFGGRAGGGGSFVGVLVGSLSISSLRL